MHGNQNTNNGIGYIPLLRHPSFNPQFNCTPGFSLMNSTLIRKDNQIVFTSKDYDYEGGADVKKCPLFDKDLNCFVDPTFQMHKKGNCCEVQSFNSRAIYIGRDQFYPGTCEADIICSSDDVTEAAPCQEGYVCGERTSSSKSNDLPCDLGFICEFGTTPDISLEAPYGQYKTLCPQGFFCPGGIGTISQELACPKDYFCPTGTGDPLLGVLADDAIVRRDHLDSNIIDSMFRFRNLVLDRNLESFLLQNDHDYFCHFGNDGSINERYDMILEEGDETNQLMSRFKQRFVNRGIRFKNKCARDSKWRHVDASLRRNECDCHSQLYLLVALFRFWKVSNIYLLYNSKRKEFLIFIMLQQCCNKSIGFNELCTYLDNGTDLSFTTGKLPVFGFKTDHNNGATIFKNYGPKKYPDYKFNVRLGWNEERAFSTYSVLIQYVREHDDLLDTNEFKNPYLLQLKRAINLIDKYGHELETLELFRSKLPHDEPYLIQTIGNRSLVPLRLDLCECSMMLKCPNGTQTEGIGAISETDCLPQKLILRRLPFQSMHYNNFTIPHIFNQTDFKDLSGTNIPIGTLELRTFDVGVFEMDLSMIPRNLTFNTDMRLSIYMNCKPCPTQYQCVKDGKECSDSTVDMQFKLLNNCLQREKVQVCVHMNGTSFNLEECLRLRESMDSRDFNSTFLIYDEPDLHKCVSSSYFCSEKTWNYASFRKVCADGPLKYDCSIHEKWKIYQKWIDGICCSNSILGTGNNLCADGHCSNYHELDWNIKQELLDRFQKEFGFEPPSAPPNGKFLMDQTIQEGGDNPNMLNFFNFWQGPLNTDQIPLPHNINNPNMSATWKKTPGCCSCKPYELPIFFRDNSKISGFPDNKHRHLHFTVSAIKPTNITVVIELLNGKFYNDFDDTYLKQSLTFRIHKPIRFSKGFNNALWLAVIKQESIENDQLEFPLNLPLGEFVDNSALDDYLLVDRPCKKLNSSIDLKFDALLKPFTYDDDGRSISPDTCTIDTFKYTNLAYSKRHDGVTDSGALAGALFLPYLPFFSNCDGFDSHIILSRLMEDHPDCHLSSPQDTQYVRQISFGYNKPYGDHCQSQFPIISGVSFGNGANLFCWYEENVKLVSDRVQWFEAKSGSTLFHLTQDALDAKQFHDQRDLADLIYRDRWIQLNGQPESVDVIPVVVQRNFGGLKNAIPRKVVLELQYYQKDHFTKRLVSASIYFSELCTTVAPANYGGDPDVLRQMQELGIAPCAVDITGRIKSTSYKLDVQIYPLVWSQLLNKFEFHWVIYFGYFTLAGLVSLFMGFMIWIIMRISTKLRHPPKFKGVLLFKTVALPAFHGNFLSVFTSATYLIAIMKVFFSENCFIYNIADDWLDTSTQILNSLHTTRAGRIGLAMLISGIVMIIFASSILIPIPQAMKAASMKEKIQSQKNFSNTKDTVDPSCDDKQQIFIWKRTQFLLCWLLIQICLLCTWEYSYSIEFEDNIFRLAILAKLGFCFMELFTSVFVQEKLLCSQLLLSVSITEVILTMGSLDFIEFTVLYLLQTVLSMCYRLYFDPFIRVIYSLVPRWYHMLRSVFKSQQNLTAKQKTQDKKKLIEINENIEMRMEGVDPLLDAMTLCSINISTRIITPCVFLLISLFYNETLIAQNHRITNRELLYYIIFSLCMIPWSMTIDVIVLHAEELLHGWRLFDYLLYQRHRFESRDCKWTLHSPYCDESVSNAFQTLDLMGFSSQYYFASGIVAVSSISVIVGTTILLRQKSYNAFSDPALGVLVAGIIILSGLLKIVIIYVGSMKISYFNWEGIWGDVNIEDNMDNILVSKLPTGEEKQPDLEKERLEVAAFQNEQFRERFLERNKPWILRHLSDLFENGHFNDSDERLKLLHYSKQLHVKLLMMETKQRRPGDRDDISSDSDDESNVGRRNWSSKEYNSSDRSIAQLWLKNAKKRAVYRKVIEGILSTAPVDYCSRCLRTQNMCVGIHAVLTGKGGVSMSLDTLLAQYEKTHDPKIYDQISWKSFVLKNTSVAALCDKCKSSRENISTQFESSTDSKHRKTRSGDFSSDSDEDEITNEFGPIILVGSDVRARLLTKWLQASRHYLGGTFPRKHAETLCRKYLEKLKKPRPLKRGELVIKNKSSARDTRSRLNYQTSEPVDISIIEKNIISKWLQNAKNSLTSRDF
jgi:hypothetical protein